MTNEGYILHRIIARPWTNVILNAHSIRSECVQRVHPNGLHIAHMHNEKALLADPWRSISRVFNLRGKSTKGAKAGLQYTQPIR